MSRPKTKPITEPTVEPPAEPASEAATAPAIGPAVEPAVEPAVGPHTARRHSSGTHPPCPKCGAPLYRVHRHVFDRLRSLFHPRRRYCCRSHSCRWEGTLPYTPKKD